MGLLNALQGFCVIGIVILAGYIAARLRIGGSSAQMVLNRFSFFVCSPCLMFAILSKEPIFDIFHSSIVVAFASAMAVGVIFLIVNRLHFHMDAAHATIGALNSLYLNSNNIGLPIATYILGDPALVAPILVMQQALFTPVGLTVLDMATTGRVSAKEVLKQPFHQPMLIASLLGIAVSVVSAQTGWFVIPDFLYDPIDMIGDAAVPMILMAFGMSLHGTRPMQDRTARQATVTVTVLKNLVMPLVAFLLSYFVMGFRGPTLYACVVLAALPTGQNVYNYAARYKRRHHLRARWYPAEHDDQPRRHRPGRRAAGLTGPRLARSVVGAVVGQVQAGGHAVGRERNPPTPARSTAPRRRRSSGSWPAASSRPRTAGT